MTNPTSGPFVPTTVESMRISMAGDDCSLHFDLDNLTPKQREDHYSNQILTAMLQVALLYIAKPSDQVNLYDTFTEDPWRQALQRYHAMFQKMSLDPLPMDRIAYHPFDSFYASVAKSPRDAELENLYMISGSNSCLHNDAHALAVSQNLNSKVHFAEHAPPFGIPTPNTLLCTKADLQKDHVKRFFANHSPPLMLKTLGLAGARNVTQVSSVSEALDYLQEYQNDLDIILQERLSLEEYTEMTVDLFVSNSDIHITNVRRILFADGLWVGNLIGPQATLNDEHERELKKLGHYALAHGYTNDIGYNLGVDYFVRNSSAPIDRPDLLVTEINARWTGGLFPAELIRRLGLEHQDVVAFFDVCPQSKHGQLMDFLEAHLYPGDFSDKGFAIAPLGFSPFPTAIDDVPCIYTWQLVVGDFEAFKATKARSLDADVLITAPLVSVKL